MWTTEQYVNSSGLRKNGVKIRQNEEAAYIFWNPPNSTFERNRVHLRSYDSIGDRLPMPKCWTFTNDYMAL